MLKRNVSSCFEIQFPTTWEYQQKITYWVKMALNAQNVRFLFSIFSPLLIFSPSAAKLFFIHWTEFMNCLKYSSTHFTMGVNFSDSGSIYASTLSKRKCTDKLLYCYIIIRIIKRCPWAKSKYFSSIHAVFLVSNCVLIFPTSQSIQWPWNVRIIPPSKYEFRLTTGKYYT